MSNREKSQFQPDYAVPPGETLLETLEARGMSQAEFAMRTGRPRKTINEIIKGKEAITPETALQFEHVLGMPAGLWNNLERNYRESLARIKEEDRLEKYADWLKKLPVAHLIKRRVVRKRGSKAEQVRALLSFFGVASPEAWEGQWSGVQAVYRKSAVFKSDGGAVAAWLRMGELTAQGIDCRPYDAAAFKSALRQIRLLTVESPEVFQNAAVKLCAQAGVALAFTQELPRLRVSGAARWLNPNKALIQLSLRYKTDDQLWFSFFHEAAHILLHGKKEIFIENDARTTKEREADEFASEFLISARAFNAFAKGKRFSKASIRQFAEGVGVAPGIVVGRLQHDGHLPHTHCNELKRRFEWKSTA